MEIYKADEQLAKIIIKQGLIETSTKDEKLMRKRTFKLFKEAERKIYFDGETIVLMEGRSFQDRRIELTEQELKLYILFFKINETDTDELGDTTVFNLSKVSEKLVALKQELKLLMKSKSDEVRRSKIAKILMVFDEIKIN